MSKPTCIIDGCEVESFARKMCKPHYRKDYYRRNKERERASNKAYREARPEYWKTRWQKYAAENREDLREKRKAAYDADPEKYRRASAEYRRLNGNIPRRPRTEFEYVTHKTCSTCGEYLSRSEFYRSKTVRDGLYARCKACFTAYCRSVYDPVKDAERGARYRSTPEAKRQARERLRQWYADNPERAREQSRRYQSRRFAAAIEDVSYPAILERDGMVCHICSDDIPSMSDLHFDHVMPLSKGGAHSYDNIKPSHASCNMRKGAKILPAA